jgi:hypothetical protein
MADTDFVIQILATADTDSGDPERLAMADTDSGDPERLAMADTDFGDPERITLLTALKKVLNDQGVPPATWASLWVSHIDKLRSLVDGARRHAMFQLGLVSRDDDSQTLVKQCEFINLCTFS